MLDGLAHLFDFPFQSCNPPFRAVRGHAHIHRLGRELTHVEVWERLDEFTGVE